MLKPRGKPGIAIYFSSKTTKKDTYGHQVLSGASMGSPGVNRNLEASAGAPAMANGTIRRPQLVLRGKQGWVCLGYPFWMVSLNAKQKQYLFFGGSLF